jgi:hypothetical protein
MGTRWRPKLPVSSRNTLPYYINPQRPLMEWSIAQF